MTTLAHAISAFNAARAAEAGAVIFNAGIIAGADAALVEAALENPETLTDAEQAKAKMLAGQMDLGRWTTAGDVKWFGNFSEATPAILATLKKSGSVQQSFVGESAAARRGVGSQCSLDGRYIRAASESKKGDGIAVSHKGANETDGQEDRSVAEAAAYNLQARALMKMERYIEAAERWRRAHDILKNLNDLDFAGGNLLSEARAWNKAGLYSEAIAVFEEAIELYDSLGKTKRIASIRKEINEISKRIEVTRTGSSSPAASYNDRQIVVQYPDFPIDILNLPLPATTRKKIEELRASPPEIVMVDLIDIAYYHFWATRSTILLQAILGDSDKVKLVHYPDVDPSMGTPGRTTIWAFSGRYLPFDAEPFPVFEKHFKRLLDMIREGTDPMLMFCAGHQLYALAFGGEAVDIGTVGEEKITIVGLNENQTITRPDHPFFETLATLSDQSVYYHHYQYVRNLTDPRAIQLAFRMAPNGVAVPTVFDHFDPAHPEIHRAAIQYHAEQVFLTDKSLKSSTPVIDIEKHGQYIAGLVQLVDILYNLNKPDEYAKRKLEYYKTIGKSAATPHRVGSQGSPDGRYIHAAGTGEASKKYTLQGNKVEAEAAKILMGLLMEQQVQKKLKTKKPPSSLSRLKMIVRAKLDEIMLRLPSSSVRITAFFDLMDVIPNLKEEERLVRAKLLARKTDDSDEHVQNTFAYHLPNIAMLLNETDRLEFAKAVELLLRSTNAHIRSLVVKALGEITLILREEDRWGRVLAIEDRLGDLQEVSEYAAHALDIIISHLSEVEREELAIILEKRYGMPVTSVGQADFRSYASIYIANKLNDNENPRN